MEEQRKKNCEQRIEDHLKGRLDDFREFLNSEDYESEDLGSICEYGLSIGYKSPEDGNPGYLQYQLSWGGPSDEFRFYVDVDLTPYKIDYVFMDWFDGATKTLSGEDKDLMLEVWDAMYLVGSMEQRAETLKRIGGL